MYETTRLVIPTVKPIAIGTFTLIDARQMKGILDEKEKDFIRGCWRRLQSFLEANRPEANICEIETSVQDRYTMELARYKKRNPGALPQEFEAQYEPVIDDTETDPRLGRLSFLVYAEDQGIVGVFHLYNVRVLSEERGLMSISAYASPYLETRRGAMDYLEVGLLMKGLLEEDLHFQLDNSVLDLVEWVFPTRFDRAWVTRGREEHAARALELLVGHDHVMVQKDGDTIPRKIRRKDA